jgi:hydrogenase maturation factor
VQSNRYLSDIEISSQENLKRVLSFFTDAAEECLANVVTGDAAHEYLRRCLISARRVLRSEVRS